jgi:hypothetical protein
MFLEEVQVGFGDDQFAFVSTPKAIDFPGNAIVTYLF